MASCYKYKSQPLRDLNNKACLPELISTEELGEGKNGEAEATGGSPALKGRGQPGQEGWEHLGARRGCPGGKQKTQEGGRAEMCDLEVRGEIDRRGRV